MSLSPAPAPSPSPREHVERIRRERYFIGRGEQNPLAEDMHQAVNYLSQELYSKDVHFLMELVQVSRSLHPIPCCSCVTGSSLVRSSSLSKFCNLLMRLLFAFGWIHLGVSLLYVYKLIACSASTAAQPNLGIHLARLQDLGLP